MSFLKKYPVPTGSLALATASLAAFWSNFVSTFAAAKTMILLSGFMVAMLIAPICLKFILHRGSLREHLRHPLLGSVTPTLAMSLMLLSKSIGFWHFGLAEKIWLFAVLLHASFLIVFAGHRIKNFDLNHIVPSWFIPPIGIVVACLTLPSMAYLKLANGILMFGLCAYSFMLPLMLFRLARGQRIDDARKPTLAILAAPASLTLSAYLTLSDSPSTTFVILMFSLAVVMTTTVYLMLFRLIRLPFTPGFSAFTFPLVISATAMLKVSAWTIHANVMLNWTKPLYYGAIVEGMIATGMTFFVLGLYYRFLRSSETLA